MEIIEDDGKASVKGTGPLWELVRRAHRRRVSHTLVRRAAVACTIGLASLAALLIAGTDILAWYWPVLLFTISFAALAFVRRPRARSDYEIAQEIDRQLDLHDALSTALYYSMAADAGRASADIIASQRRAAEEQAAAADLSRAMPFVAPRSFYVAGCLAVMVFGLFAARYGMRRSLDLHAAMVRFPFHQAFPTTAANQDPSSPARKNASSRDKSAELFDPALTSQPAVAGQKITPNATLQPVQSALRPGAGSPGPLELNPGESPEDAAGENGDAASKKSESSQRSGGERAAASGTKQGNAENSEGQAGEQTQSPQQENSSLIERMRDAMAGLLSKLKMPQNAPEAKQQSSRGGNQNSGKSGSNGPGSPTQENAQQSGMTPEGQAGAQGKTGAATQSARGRSNENGGESSDAADSKSGIGRQDGSKDPKLAEQLAAMGRISEIIGRRSRTVTGEVMVEVPSGKEQRLSTAYSGRKSAHMDDTGEISRDEVPLAYQQYVQDYFDQIRKLAGPKGETRR